MNRPAGFSYICPNCNHIGFVYTDLEPTLAFTCIICRERLPSTSIIKGINLNELKKDGFPMTNIPAQKISHWKKLETQPDELELVSETPFFACPFCHSGHQQFVVYSQSPYRVGLLCPNCSAIYYGEWVDNINEDGSYKTFYKIFIPTGLPAPLIAIVDLLPEGCNVELTDMVYEDGHKEGIVRLPNRETYAIELCVNVTSTTKIKE